MNATEQNKAVDETSNWALTVRLLKFSWQYKFRCIQVLSYQLIMLFMGLSGLGLTGLGIDFLRYQVVPDTGPPKWPFGLAPPADLEPLSVIMGIAVTILGFALFRSCLNYLYTMSMGKLIYVDIVATLRALVFEKMQKLSFRFFDANASGTIINRVASDVGSLRRFMEGVFIQSFIMILSLVVYLVYMLNIHVLLTLACLATTPLLWIVSVIFSKKTRPLYMENRTLMDNLVMTFVEHIQGINTIKGFYLEKDSIEKFEQATGRVRNQRQRIFNNVTIFAPFVGLLTQINLVILLGYGGYLVVNGELSIGTGIVVFAGLLQQFSGQIANLAGIVDSIQQSLTGARRVFEILDAPIEVTPPENPHLLVEAKGAVRFEHVHFKYHERNTVLNDVDFTVAPGEVIAIAGATGSGKSALMSLIPRFYDPNEGRILLDGHDLRTLRLEDIRHNIGLVFQESFLFSNTIASNIAFGHPDASREQIVKAATIAAAHEFIEEMPDGYDSIISESGVNLSGGQRQRLAIARALLLEPAVLLLDDPTASVDPETEHEILEAIENAIQGRTTFIVAHRLSTLRRADRIIVLDHGRIVETGRHDELMRQKGTYSQAINIQAIDPASMKLLKATRTKRDGKS